MDFIRKKKRGMNQKTQRLWLHPDGYRITWRKEAFGVPVLARYHACVKILMPGAFENGYKEMWDFVESKRTYGNMKTAVADCEKHARLWARAAQCPGIRAIQELFGYIPCGIPKWAISKLNGRVLKILLDTKPYRVVDIDDDESKSKPTLTPKPTPRPTTKKRKPRSDKGKPRGPRKRKEHTNG